MGYSIINPNMQPVAHVLAFYDHVGKLCGELAPILPSPYLRELFNIYHADHDATASHYYRLARTWCHTAP